MRVESFHPHPPQHPHSFHPLPGFTLPHIAPSAHDVFTPHLLLCPCLRFFSSATLAKSPPDEKTGAKQRQLGCLSGRKPTIEHLLFLHRKWSIKRKNKKKTSNQKTSFQVQVSSVRRRQRKMQRGEIASFSNLPLLNCVPPPPTLSPPACTSLAPCWSSSSPLPSTWTAWRTAHRCWSSYATTSCLMRPSGSTPPPRWASEGSLAPLWTGGQLWLSRTGEFINHLPWADGWMDRRTDGRTGVERQKERTR